jgi:hypothetical protein
MKLPFRRHRTVSRGQALVEFAIILPLLMLLLVMAIDGGRVFFGWVALQNASRIGADYAAAHADAWKGTPDQTQQDQRDRYELLIRQDLQSLGCQDTTVIPEPNFDPDGDGISDFDDGALVRVDLACAFGLLTPLAEAALGGPVTLHASADFAVNRTINTGLPPASDPPPPLPCGANEGVVPLVEGETMQDAVALWEAEGFDDQNFSPLLVLTGPNQNKNKIVQPGQSRTPGSCLDVGEDIVVTYS